MSQFDAKHGIDKRRKNLFTATIMLSFSVGILCSMAIVFSNKDLLGPPLGLLDFIQTSPRFLLVVIGAFGIAAIFGYLAYKILSWFDRSHAVAAVRSLMLSPDPYND